jgi:ATP-dependent helicase/nuclease subunit A
MSDAAAREAALDPTRSILLQAPAGSGKTTVLAQRFLRLLARVDEPEQVLAITFTRKAAAEMRERVLRALEETLDAKGAQLDLWKALRREVLAQAERRGWPLLELPTRLRIQTIDSFNHELARSSPLLGRLQSALQVVDDAQALYARAARQTLQEAEVDAQYQADADLLLGRLDNNWASAEKLIALLLASRAQWLPVILGHSPKDLAAVIEFSLSRIARQLLQDAQSAMGSALCSEATTLARLSASNLAKTSPEHRLQTWLDANAALVADVAQLPAWQAVVDLALTGSGGDGQWRKEINKNLGFPPEDKLNKARWADWRDALSELPGSLHLLRSIRALPALQLSTDDCQALAALARLLQLAAGELQLVFASQGRVDHVQVGAIARQALTAQGDPTDLGLRQTLRLQHLLVDEFQDISPDQLQLIEALTVGWQQEPSRTLFLVGDPMQSIYLFRSSEVGLFLQVRSQGVGGIALELQQLTHNFRSVPPLVDWSNQAFAQVFPQVEDIRSSAVTFLPSTATQPLSALLGEPVTVLPQPTSDRHSEAKVIAREIASLQRQSPSLRIAVLVQAKSFAPPILDALKVEGIDAVGVNLAPLSECPSVRDLIALGRALLHAGDRIAWLAVLRAPMCGLSLPDLLAVAGDYRAIVVEQVRDSNVLMTLSEDGQQRLRRCAPLLLRAFDERYRQGLASEIETLWLQLGGPQVCADSADQRAAEQFIFALRNLELEEDSVDAAQLETLAQRLRDSAAGEGNNCVEILTIHHAKGLEWDVVFIPGLGRGTGKDKAPLLRWAQLPAEDQTKDLLMAVHSIGEAADSDPLSHYIKQLQNERLRNERVRLAYVAATRARQKLYLLGAVPIDKSQEPKPTTGSQLAILWPALRQHFVAASVEVGQSASADLPLGPGPWHRLPAQFERKPTADLISVSGLSGGTVDLGSKPEFSWVGPSARAAGTVVHGELEFLATVSDLPALDFFLRRARYRKDLRQLGVAPAEAESLADSIAHRFTQLATDATVHWLLSPQHRQARSELRLTGMVAGRIRNIIVDRTFVDADSVRWVIDYKTSSHSGGGLNAFLDAEVERYRSQLELYRILVQRQGPEPVRVALYFPWLGVLRELA